MTEIPEGIDEDDVLECRVCGKTLGYWDGPFHIRAFEGFKMCMGGVTCLPCLEADDDCDDDSSDR
jgi:hypothetical protein